MIVGVLVVLREGFLVGLVGTEEGLCVGVFVGVFIGLFVVEFDGFLVIFPEDLSDE